MKKMLKMAVYAIAAIALTSCSTDLTEDLQPSTGETVELTLHATLSSKTRTVIGELSEDGTYPVLWDKNGEYPLTVFEYVDGQLAETVTAYLSDVSDDQKTAAFKANFTQKSGKTFDYYAYYQASSYKTDYFYLSGYQYPREDSFYPYAALMLAKNEGNTVQGGGELDFSFEHIVAYSRMTLTGLQDALDGSKIREIQFYTPDVNCGNFDYDVRTGDMTPRQLGNGAYNIMRLDVRDFGYDGSEPFEVWFTTFPIEDIKSFTVYVYTENGKNYSKRFTVGDSKTFSLEKGVVSRYTVDMTDHSEEIYERQRNALISLYKSTNGDNWIDKTNWCSDTPLGQWYGVYTDSQGYVYYINLSDNGLNGTLPQEIGDLTHLRYLYMSSYNGNNCLTGELPESFGNLTLLEDASLMYNQLSGTIPQSVQQASWWSNLWISITQGNNFDLSTAAIPAPEFSVRTLDGSLVDNGIYSKNKYTVLFHWAYWCGYTQRFTPTLVELYERYKNHGMDVLGWTSQGTLQDVEDFIKVYDIPWQNAYCNRSDSEHYPLLNINFFPAINVVDSEGSIVFNCVSDNYNNLGVFLREHLGDGDDPEYYESTDFSSDKMTRTIQNASKGNGINIVLMGDGFSDRLIADGTYDKVMNTAAEALFSEEPYKSFRDLFNVHVVYAVSKNEGYHNGGETVFSGYFGGGTHVGGNDTNCINYALTTVSNSQMDNTLIVVMMNSYTYAGTCYMYSPVSPNDYSSGTSVAYFPIGTSSDALAQVLHHEACGHGFAKLDDEYSYESYGTIPSDEIEQTKMTQNNWGWWKNVDFTNDLSQIRWSYFLTDYRYANEGLGAYEGASTYWSGVWRPTENSIMRYNTGGFNAPSREAIYYRIHKLAYGDSWQYNYEDFVTYDAINRNNATTRAKIYRPENFEPLHPPVIVNKTWKDAK